LLKTWWLVPHFHLEIESLIVRVENKQQSSMENESVRKNYTGIERRERCFFSSIVVICIFSFYGEMSCFSPIDLRFLYLAL
jgi:hypothetical protein